MPSISFHVTAHPDGTVTVLPADAVVPPGAVRYTLTGARAADLLPDGPATMTAEHFGQWLAQVRADGYAAEPDPLP